MPSQQTRVPLSERCVGKWGAILGAIGIDRSFLSGKHGPCIFCQGRDRWRWINRNGSGDWTCNSCGHGSGMDLAMRYLKTDFKGAAERIEAVIGEARMDRVKPKPDDKKLRAAMVDLWRKSVPIVGTVGEVYCCGVRGIPVPDPAVVRFVERCWYDRDHEFPALVAKVVNTAGEGVNLHRTYLAPDGSGKAPVKEPRLTMRGTIPPGAAIRLYPAGETLGIAEGLENAASAYLRFSIPTWSVLNTTGIKNFVVPEGVKRLVIYGDCDRNFAGAAAAYVRANRAIEQDKIECEVMIPDAPGEDWNSILLRENLRAA
jgi:putative DNA primase/helicase